MTNHESLASPNNSASQRLQEVNYDNLTPDEEQVICDDISDFFKTNFSQYEGISENAEKLSTNMHFLGNEEYNHAFEQRDSDDSVIDYTPAFYDATAHAIYINRDPKEDYTDAERTTFLIHEAFHFCAIENGAGFNTTTSSFSIPDEIFDNPELTELLQVGVLALCEGTTDLLAVEATGEMGLDEYERGYPIERDLVRGVRQILGREEFERAFFEMPLEEFRLRFEAAGLSQEEIEQSDEIFTGSFSAFLVELGNCVTYCKKLLDAEENPSDETIQEIHHAMTAFCDELDDFINGDQNS